MSNIINDMVRRAALRGYAPIQQPDSDDVAEHQDDDDGPVTADPDQGQGVRREPRQLSMNDMIRAAVGVQPW